MPDAPINDERLWEMLESCPRGSDLSGDPALQPLVDALARCGELRALKARLEETDEAIGAALERVPVPAGLAERLAEGLCGGRMSVEIVAAPRSPVARRWLLAGAASLAVAASLLFAVLVGLNQWQTYSASQLVELAVSHFASEDREPWQTGPWPAEFPFSRDLVRFRDTHWRRVPDFLGRPAVAYDLPPLVAGGRATLYVVGAKVSGLPPMPPSKLDFQTGLCAAAAWHSDGLVYVLVIEGGDRGKAYRAYLDQSAGPLA